MSSLSALTLKRSGASTVVEGAMKDVPLHCPIHPWPIDSASKNKGFSGFGADDEVLVVDRAFHAPGLVGTLEVAFNRVSGLLELEILGRSTSIRVVTVERPLPGDIGRG
jgi:hypothetical protein